MQTRVVFPSTPARLSAPDRLPYTGYPVPGAGRCSALGVGPNQVPGTRSQVPDSQYPIPGTRCQAPVLEKRARGICK